ncbi:hypothetical protein ACIQB5_48905 [Streptomyces sp. NPDC088560]
MYSTACVRTAFENTAPAAPPTSDDIGCRRPHRVQRCSTSADESADW